MKRGRIEVLTIVIVLLLVLVGFSLFDVINEKLSKKEISGGVVSNQGSTDKGLGLKQLTDQLNNLNTNLRVTSAQTRISLNNNLVQVAKQRKELMLDLIEKDPELVLKNALKQEVIDSMPDNVKENLEKRVSKQGDLEVLIEDDFENKKSREEYYLNENGKRSSLHFVDEGPFGLISGTKVKLSGLQIDNKIALYKNPTDEWHTLEVLSVPDTSVNLGEQKTIVILVDFLDDGNPTKSKEDLYNDILNSDNPSSINSFYKEVSYNKAWLSGDIFGWYTFSGNSNCDSNSILSKALQAADYNVFFPDYKRIILIFPYNPSCHAAGWAYIGLRTIDTPDGSISASVAWINGDVYTGSYPTSILSSYLIAHELGHNFGAQHSGTYECGEKVYLRKSNECISLYTSDLYDIMSYIGVGLHLNSISKEVIGWLDSQNILEVPHSGSYILKPFEVATQDIQVLKVPRMMCPLPYEDGCGGNDINGWYYLEYRRAVGFDRGLNEEEYGLTYNLSGPIFHIDRRWGPQLIDMTPHIDTSGYYDRDFSNAVLPVGQTFYDLYNGFSINTVNINDETIEVKISSSNGYCEDGIDNDLDYKVDLDDPGCSNNPLRNSEVVQCEDGIDNDKDMGIDLDDTDCGNTPFRDSETIECEDGIDNDKDFALDYPNDFSCTSSNDDDEFSPKTACQDTLDNDGDGVIDYPQDLGCSSLQDYNEVGQCQDGIDNDNDSYCDFYGCTKLGEAADVGCISLNDNYELNAICIDGEDNDGDGLIDYPSDPGCDSTEDDDEFDPNDIDKFYIKNSQGNNVAWFGDSGNIVLKGTCQVQANCLPPVDSFIFKNGIGETVAYVDINGNLCIETGDCSSSPSCSATSNDEFIMQDETGKVVSKIDLTNGDLCYIGRLIENGNP